MLGLIGFGVGIAMMVLGDLGLAPWDVLHQGLSETTGLRFGTVLNLVGFAIVLLFIPLGEQMGVGTILNAILIGFTVNVVVGAFDAPDPMLARLLLTIGGPMVIAIGSGLYIGGGLGPGPRDGLMTGLGKRGVPIAKARTGIEMTALLAGLALLRDLSVLGLGTVWFTFGIGPMVAFCLPRIAGFIESFQQPG